MTSKSTLRFASLAALFLAGALGGCDGDSATTDSASNTAGSTATAGTAGSAGAASGAAGTAGSGAAAGTAGTAPVNLECSDDPSLTAQERQLIEMPADSWLEAPSSHFIDFCPANEPPGSHTVQGCGAIITAWGGGAWDPIHKKMILWGGGHNDYWGNEVYGFSTQSFKWELLVPGSPIGSVDEISEPMPDGTPDSRHTYDGLVYLTAENRLFAFGGATAPNGYSSILTWALDIDKKSWEQLDPKQTLPSNPDGYYWMGSDYDQEGHRVFMRNEDGVFVYDLAKNDWTRLIDAGFPPLYPDWSNSNYRRGVFDPKRKIFFTLGGKNGAGKPDFFAYDTVANKPVYDQWVTAGGDDIAGGHAPGADYDPVADAIVAWSGGPARVLDLATKQWSTRSGAGAPAKAVENGTYGRFRYIRQYNVFVLVNEPDENVFFYKHTAGCGP
jgi:hypothetical protein